MIRRNSLAAALAVEAVLAAALMTVTLDLWAHRRVEELGGVNVWGYRGNVLARKRAGEIRVAVVGGDLAFGWGQAAGGTLASAVRRLVMLETDRPGRPLHPITAVNLSAQSLRPTEYASWIERFAYLDLDVVCIVADPRTYRSWREWPVPDRRSGVFALFGYAPMLPLVLQEKGVVAGSPALSTIGKALRIADHALARAVHRESQGPGGHDSRDAYVGGLETGVRAALTGGASVVLVAPPHYGADDREDHEALAAMMHARFGPGRQVRFLDLGKEPGIDAAGLRLNDLDFSSAGIARAAESIAPPVTALVRAVIE